MEFPDLEQKDLKFFLVLKIIAFELGSTNFHNFEEDTCHCQSICYQATLRNNISLRQIFPKSGCLRVMKKQVENGLMEILQEFGTV